MTTLNTITSVGAIQAADTKTLIEFYNEFNPEKPIKKFADRATAEKRCEVLFNELVEEGQIEVAPKAPAKSGKKVAAKEPETNTESSTEQALEGATNDSFTWPFADKNIKSSITGTPDKESGAKKQETAKPARSTSHIGNASNAAGISASWSNPEVASARLTRNGVTVTVKGQTTEHKSTRDAFRHYRLMDSKHIRFRGILKAAGSAVYAENGVEYSFTIVG